MKKVYLILNYLGQVLDIVKEEPEEGFFAEVDEHTYQRLKEYFSKP